MSKNYILIIYICLLTLFTGCNKEEKVIDEKNIFREHVQSIIDIVDEEKNLINYELAYYSYGITNGYLQSPFGNSYDMIDNSINKSFIFVNNKLELYLSLETDKYCAIKDFNDNQFSIYDISENENCHKFNTINNEEISISLSAYNLDNNQSYLSGEISNDYISLIANDNIVDYLAVDYKWYRNNVEITDANVPKYVISRDLEDADYYVEIITPNGEILRSNSVNVKIDRR